LVAGPDSLQGSVHAAQQLRRALDQTRSLGVGGPRRGVGELSEHQGGQPDPGGERRRPDGPDDVHGPVERGDRRCDVVPLAVPVDLGGTGADPDHAVQPPQRPQLLEQ
jgi:hypothetical protein